MTKRLKRSVWALGLLAIASVSWAKGESQRLPEPLTLDAALAIAAEQDPRVILAQARSQQAHA